MAHNVDEELRQKGLRYCQEFLGGTWKTLEQKDFGMEYIVGGLSNMLYLCSLPDEMDTLKCEPRQVVLRIYGQIIRENPETVVLDSVVFGLLAEKKMGPKLYGVFTDGRVEEYVKSRHLYTHELHQPDISEECAVIMAKFHKLQMPLRKEPTWLPSVMTRYLSEALNNVSFDTEDQSRKRQLSRLLSFQLATELDNLKLMLSRVDSPVVFCHNDLQEGNILYCTEDKSWRLVPIDFEYASYNYRGFDMGNHMCEWCYNYSVTEPPYFEARLENYPKRDQQIRFIRTYLREFPPEGDWDSQHMEQAMLDEIAVGALASHFLWGLWSIVQSHVSIIKFDYLAYALTRFDAYFIQKEQLPERLLVNGI